MSEDPFYEKRVLPRDERARLFLTVYDSQFGWSLKEPPWWRPFARRRFKRAIALLSSHAATDLLTPPPS